MLHLRIGYEHLRAVLENAQRDLPLLARMACRLEAGRFERAGARGTSSNRASEISRLVWQEGENRHAQ